MIERMGNRRRQRERQPGRGWVLAGVGILAIATVALTGLALTQSTNTRSAAAQPSYSAVPQITEASTTPLVGVLGDSWSGGAGSRTSNEKTSFARLALQQAGVGGKIFAEGGTGYTVDSTWGAAYPDRLDELIEYAPDAVLIQGGANDYAATDDELHDAALRTYDAVADALPEATIIVLGPLYSIDGDNDSVDSIRAVLADAAEERGIEFIDPVAEEWMPLDPAFYSDGYHPNAEGHGMIAKRLAPSFAELSVAAG